ncbi:hypothetical protein ES703_33033 [subsurface metagenome]
MGRDKGLTGRIGPYALCHKKARVERAHRTHTEEFYEVTEISLDLAELRNDPLEWEQLYNTVRPHQALDYLTPLKFLKQRKEHLRKEVMCH